MNSLHVLLAFLLPTLVGWSMMTWLLERPRGLHGFCAGLGAGHLLGSLGWGWLLRFFEGAPTRTLFVDVAPWMGGVAIVAVALAIVALRRSAPPADVAPPTAGERAFIVLMLLLLAASFAALVLQAVALPTLAWDAWNVWIGKAKAWYFAGALQPIVSFDAWIAAAPGEALNTIAWNYPDALSRHALWLTSAAGTWSEGSIHLAWPLAWAALGLACFGYLGSAGCRTSLALAATTGLLTLPMLTAHAALAGYADLWLAAVLMLAALHAARALQQRHARNIAAALLFAALLPAIKTEGGVWLGCLIGAALLTVLPARVRWLGLGSGLALWLLALPWGGLRVPVPGLGLARLGWAEIEMPRYGTLPLTLRPVLDEFAQAMFVLPNWSLLWYLAPLLIALRWRALLATRERVALGLFLALGYAFLFVLFFLTDAAAWAENFTSLNRVLLHIVPISVAWLALAWSMPAPRDTGSTTRR